LLVGGTGLYVRAVLDGLRIPEVPPDAAVRAGLEQVAAEQGALALHARLHAVDPAAAAAIDPRNVRRVVRALEVCLVTGVPISRLQECDPPPYRILRIGLTRSRASLYQRIDRRVDTMIERGLEKEVRQLLAAGYSPRLPALTGLGYSQMIRYVRGEVGLAQAIAEIKQQTRRYVRQQGTWFRADDARIRWFDLEQEEQGAIVAAVEGWLAEDT
jgi:tRNA dimethylallyltransferase